MLAAKCSMRELDDDVQHFVDGGGRETGGALFVYLSHDSNTFIQRPNSRKPEKTNLLRASRGTHVQTTQNRAIASTRLSPPCARRGSVCSSYGHCIYDAGQWTGSRWRYILEALLVAISLRWEFYELGSHDEQTNS